MLDGLARAGLVTLTSENFRNAEGRDVSWRKVAFTPEGRAVAYTGALGVLLPEESPAPSTVARRAKAIRRPDQDADAPFTAAQTELEERLRAWRRNEAAQAGKPAFFVLTDAVLRSVVIASPASISQLLGVSGIGPRKADLYGASICALCRGHDAP
jgi:ATP-dependent DNA helicase RecQ